MKNALQHPSTYINASDVGAIRINAAEAEALGMLHPDQLAIIYREQWFKLLVPTTYSGRQISLPNLVRLQEAISWTDGSTGWVVTLCSGAGWFGGFIGAHVGNEIFNNAEVCLAGSGAVGGTAEITETGYIINGNWKYASGAHHATHITANCRIIQNGESVLNVEGEPLILPFVLDKADVTILPAWKYIGMVATGSDAFEIKDLKVRGNRQFKIEPSAVAIDAPLYHYPFMQLAEATLAVNISGMAIHFMDCCASVFKDRMNHPRLTADNKQTLTDELSFAHQELDELRKPFFEAVDASWQSIARNNTVPNAELKAVSITSRKLAITARQIVDRLYPLCGLIAASTDSEINRAWRDRNICVI
jgi:alkylation response protein AidB-like acyl-CoA dehydrogenase